jgi:hypothetical protein
MPPATAAARTRRDSCDPKRTDGRHRKRMRRKGISRHPVMATVAAVVPIDSTSHPAASRPPTVEPRHTAPYQAYAPITARLDSNGANAGHANARCACSTPVKTTPTPYSGSCGANTRIIAAPNATRSASPEPSRSDMIGWANAATSAAAGTRISSAQVNRPEAARSARTGRRRASGPATNGTTTLDSAPPATIS